jgi:hypothetical protein
MGQDSLMTRQMPMGYRGQAGVRGAAAGADDADDYTNRGPLADEQLQKSFVPEFHDWRIANK